MNTPKYNKAHLPWNRVYKTLLVGLLVGLGLGITSYLLGYREFIQPESGSVPRTTEGEAIPTNHLLPDFSESALDSIFSLNLGYAHLVQLSQLLDTLNKYELFRLFKQSAGEVRSDRRCTVQAMLLESLVQNYPEEALVVIFEFPDFQRHSLLRDLFTHWASANLEEAMLAASVLTQDNRKVALNTIFRLHKRLTDQEFSSLVSNFELETDLGAWNRQIDTYESLELDPSKSFDQLVNDKIGDEMQTDLYRQVVTQWVKRDGLRVLVELEAAKLDRVLFDELFDQITEQDRITSLTYLKDVDHTLRIGLGDQFVKHWVEDDVEGAFQALSRLPKSSFRNSMMYTVVSEWSRREPSIVLERMFEIPRMLRTDALTYAAIALADENPKHALDQISGYRSIPGINVDQAIESVVRAWSTTVPDESLKWIQANFEEGTLYRTELIAKVLPQYALVEPEKAMELSALEFNPEFRGFGLGRSVITALVFGEKLDKAAALLGGVQDVNRLPSYIEVGTALVEKDDSSKAVTIADALPEGERVSYFNQVATRLLIFNQASKVLDLISKMSDEEIQADVAGNVLDGGYGTKYFNEEEIIILQSYDRD